MATQILADPPALRTARRRRVLDAMAAADIDILVLGREANTRYVSGAPRLWTAGSRAFGPGCVLVRSTEAVHLLSTWDEGIPDDIPHENLYGISFNAGTFIGVLRGIEGAATARSVATDAMAPSTPFLFGKAFGEARIVDGDAMLAEVRVTKAPEEVEAIRNAVALAADALEAVAAAVEPGRTSRELTGIALAAMADAGLTTPSHQDWVWVGHRDRPGRRDRDTPIEVGDLVGLDAGVLLDGYVGQIGRTVVAGGADAGDATDLLDALVTACKPGQPTSVLLDTYRAQRVDVPSRPIAQGLGMGYDLPVVVGSLPATAAARTFAEGMTLTVTAEVFEQGRGTTTITEPVVITATGAESLFSSRSTP